VLFVPLWSNAKEPVTPVPNFAYGYGIAPNAVSNDTQTAYYSTPANDADLAHFVGRAFSLPLSIFWY
jgi:hypothetical protein